MAAASAASALASNLPRAPLPIPQFQASLSAATRPSSSSSSSLNLVTVWRSPIFRSSSSSSGGNVQFMRTSWACDSSVERKRRDKLSAKGFCRNVQYRPTSWSLGSSLERKRLSAKGFCGNVQCTSWSRWVVWKSSILRSSPSSGGNVQFTPTSWTWDSYLERKRRLRLPALGLCKSFQYTPTSWSCGPSLERKKLSAKGLGLRFRKKCGVVVVMAVGRHLGQEAARDRVVDFGKFKGSMMGTLSSKYLKWMVNNLKAGSLSEWSDYAEEVLADPYYTDRLEWEKVEKLMTEAHDVGSITGNRDVVLAPARMYGWDLEDDVGWRKVNFSLIGTTKGGRIPRVKGGVPLAVPEQKKQAPKKMRKQPASIRTVAMTTTRSLSASSTSAAAVDNDTNSSGSLREELLRRRAQRRDRLTSSRALLGGNEEAEAHLALNSRFPGRESLLSTIRNYDISE